MTELEDAVKRLKEWLKIVGQPQTQLTKDLQTVIDFLTPTSASFTVDTASIDDAAITDCLNAVPVGVLFTVTEV